MNPEEDVLYYIVFDPVTLLQFEAEEYCGKLYKKFNVEIVNYSVSDFKHKNSLSQCIKELMVKVKDSRKRLHVFVDEFDTEHLTEKESLDLNLLFREYIKESYVVVVTQSVQKSRYVIDQDKGPNSAIPTHCFGIMEETMGVITLTKVMRYTNDIMTIVESIQNNLENAIGNIYSVLDSSTTTFNVDLREISFNDSSDKTSTINNTVDLDSTDSGLDDFEIQSSTNIDEQLLFNSSIAVNDSQLDISFDRSMKLFYSTNDDAVFVDNGHNLETRFNFCENTGCGHKINGQQPSLIRLPFSATKRDVAGALLELTNPRFKKTLFICTDLITVKITYKALSELGIIPLHYVVGLMPTTSPEVDRKQIYKDWMDSNHRILLTDNLGCRGLQHENVRVSNTLFVDTFTNPNICFR